MTEETPSSKRGGQTTRLESPGSPEGRTAGAACEILRRRATEADDELHTPGDLAETWNAILAGRLAIVDHFYSSERWYLALASRAGARPIEARERRLIVRLLLGESQKCAAAEIQRSKSSVSTNARRTLSRLGLCVSASKAPPMIALLARAGTGGEVPSARFSRLRHGEDEILVVSVERPQIRPPFQLAPSERDVTDLLVQGKSYEEIARARGRSVRTIANQISSVFRRLGLSGRGELVARLVAEGSAPVRRPERVPA